MATTSPDFHCIIVDDAYGRVPWPRAIIGNGLLLTVKGGGLGPCTSYMSVSSSASRSSSARTSSKYLHRALETLSQTCILGLKLRI